MTPTSRSEERRYEELSPFELKSRLLSIASTRWAAGSGSGARGGTGAPGTGPLLDAGRGNPNWVATEPREAFFLLGTFALGECRRTAGTVGIAGDAAGAAAVGIGGTPSPDGIAGRLERFLAADPDAPGAALVRRVVDLGISEGFDPDPWVHELASGIIGDHYPGPDRMSVHAERIVHRYLRSELCGDHPIDGRFDLFAVEGGTAAMCYIFDSLTTNRLLRRGDRVALMVPTFTPYLEIPRLDRYGFEIVEVHASACDDQGAPTWQCPDDELAKLADPSVKALFVVNPSNPASVMLSDRSIGAIAEVIAGPNPDLIVVSDDVYGTFVPGFTSLMAFLPHNVIGVYSFSKYFGCTGWRLGIVALHTDNVVDGLLGALPAEERAELDRRYRRIALDPSSLRFIDRMVADSRQVALNHTAGLSLPQQVQMTLFAAAALVEGGDRYRDATRALVGHRLGRLYEGMGIALPDDPLRAGYYAEIDLMDWARRRHGEPFAAWLVDRYEPVDPIFRLAEQTGIVLLPGGGFDGPMWSVRVSLANLPDDCYAEIGAGLRTIFNEYVDEFERSTPAS